MVNGHEWAKHQLTAAQVRFAELDNGLWIVDDPAAAQKICARLGSGQVRALIDRWLPSLPSPLTASDGQAGYHWAFSIRRLEVADTAVFERPAVGRAWFEAAIRDHLDLGRPDRVKVVFDRRLVLRGKNQTPGCFSTQVITPGTRARIEIRYKTSGAKAYLKEDKALPSISLYAKPSTARTGGRLRRAGEQVNDRFLAALGEGSPGLPDVAVLQAIVLPTVHDQHAPGLRFGDPRVMALLASIASLEHVTAA